MPAEASVRPESSAERWQAMVVEPMSTAMPQAKLCSPGQSAITTGPPRSWCTAAVTFHSPSRRIFCTFGRRSKSILQPLEAPFLREHAKHPVGVAERLVHVRLVDLDVAELGDRIALDQPRLGALPDDLPVDLHVLRHVDDEVALDGGVSRRGGAGSPARRGSRT